MKKRLSPRTQQLVDTAKALAREFARGEESVQLLDFAWRPTTWVKGSPRSSGVIEQLQNLQSTMRWRALLYVGPRTQTLTKVYILDVSGDEIYGMNYHHSNGNVTWCHPDPLIADSLRDLRRRG